eukprot:3824325-Prymnesium_polylepis.2
MPTAQRTRVERSDKVARIRANDAHVRWRADRQLCIPRRSAAGAVRPRRAAAVHVMCVARPQRSRRENALQLPLIDRRVHQEQGRAHPQRSNLRQHTSPRLALRLCRAAVGRQRWQDALQRDGAPHLAAVDAARGEHALRVEEEATARCGAELGDRRRHERGHAVGGEDCREAAGRAASEKHMRASRGAEPVVSSQLLDQRL